MSYYPTSAIMTPYTVGTGLISNGNTAVWQNPTTNLSNSNGDAVLTIPHNKKEVILEKAATLDVKGNIVMNGIDLEERLKTIEKVLQIPERDVILEKKYPKLKKMYDEYIAALGKYRTFEAIKGDQDGTT